MQKTFEIIAGVLILVFIGVVLWQMIDRESAGDFLGQEEFLIDQISDPGGSANEERIPEEFGYEIIPPEDAVVCSMDVMECPDGSFVGRAGPSCDFKDCLGGMLQEEDSVVVCSPEAKSNQICTMDYSPVCGSVQIQCVTTPCDPIPETFSNGCGACAEGNVIYYTEGACEEVPMMN